MKHMLVVILLILASANYVNASDVIVTYENMNGDDVYMKLKNVKVQHIDNTADEYITIFGFDRTKISIPLSSIKIVFKRDNNIVVKTVSNGEYLSIMSELSPHFVGENEIDGKTSFSLKKISYVQFVN